MGRNRHEWKRETIMPVLNIRNLPAEVHARLGVRAARAGRSMEAEARAILTAVCLESESRRPAAGGRPAALG